ncbi:hypothetical protein ACFL2Q_06100 [Thermodesulfobacteriota bacterium]
MEDKLMEAREEFNEILAYVTEQAKGSEIQKAEEGIFRRLLELGRTLLGLFGSDRWYWTPRYDGRGPGWRRLSVSEGFIQAVFLNFWADSCWPGALQEGGQRRPFSFGRPAQTS